MIPKKIHYCWLGGNPLPESAKKCIKSWKKYCPDYEIIEWNESNLDINSAPLYIRQAYEVKKYGFVPDYFRVKIIHEHGGIYLDTDVEIVKSFDKLLKDKCFFGFEDDGDLDAAINLGHGFGGEKGLPIFVDIMEQYSDMKFINDDGSYNTVASPEINTEVFISHGLKQQNKEQILDDYIHVYPSEYFCPKSFIDGVIRKTKNTYSIHHFDASWLSKESQDKMRSSWKRKQKRAKQKAFRAKVKGVFIKIFGENFYNKLRKK